MNLKLHRLEYTSDGILGSLSDESGQKLMVTLEHSYDAKLGNGSYLPKTPKGTYTCVRGLHRLERMTTPFETFQVLNVPGHSNILLHVGNFNKDSDGCILLGTDIAYVSTKPMITHSKVAFQRFMDLQKDVEQFILEIT